MLDLISLSVQDLGIKDNLEKYAGNVTFSGLLIVFAMLILLVLLIAGFGTIMVKLTGKPKTAKSEKVVKAEKPKKAPAAEKASKPVLVADDNSDDVIAAISAAVMMMYEGTGVKPVIRSVRPVASQRSAWKIAGIANNTRSF